MSKDGIKRMFNPDVKEQYIQYVVSTSESQDVELYKKGLINRFIRSEPLETEFGKDILDMSHEELKLFFSKFLRGGKDYQLNTFGAIRSYCAWGISNGLSNITSTWPADLKLTDIKVDQVYVDTMVSSEDDLIIHISPHLRGINDETQDNILRCVFLLLFAGIQYDDIWYLKTTDIDLSSWIINYKNRSIPMSNNLYEIVSHNLKMDCISITRKGNVDSLKEIINEGYLISNTRQYGTHRDRMKRSFNATISKIFSECEKALTNTSIYNSGVFYRIYINEKESGEINCFEYLWARRNQTTTIEFPERVKEKCKYEYSIWKQSFNLD